MSTCNRFPILLPLVLAVIATLSSCVPETTNVTVVEKQADLGGEGLNLQALGELAKSAHSAEELEQKLNQPGGINNLDLNHDGRVNYINVVEVASDTTTRGFDLRTRLTDGTDVDLATIRIQRTSEQHASIAVAGSPQYYGTANTYHSTALFTDLVILSWLWAPHPLWYHPAYYYGFYPSYYSVYHPVPVATYTTRTYQATRNSSFAPAPRSTLSKPLTSQKSFEVRSPSKPVSSGAFGAGSAGPSKPIRLNQPARRSSGSFGKRR